MSIRVVVADDHALVRAGFRALLERTDGIEVVGEAGDGIAALALVRAVRPDVVLMDVRMPALDGIEVTRAISDDATLGGVRVIVLTTFELDDYVFAALRAGASGFLVKTIQPDDLRRAVAAVAAGDALLAPTVTRRLIAAFVAFPTRTAEHTSRLGLLTQRQREILVLTAKGDSNAEIARQLGLSPATVKAHISHTITKLGLHDRAGLVVFAYESGLLSQPLP